MNTNNETMDWKAAAKAWGEGKELQFRTPISYWMDFNSEKPNFDPTISYRLKPQAEEKPTVAETTSSSPKPKRFEYRDRDLFWDNKEKTHWCDSDEISGILNRLHEENEALKAKIDEMRLLNKTLDGAREELMAELSQVKEELADVKADRDCLKVTLRYGNAYKEVIGESNAKQTSPVEKTDNTLKESYSDKSYTDKLQRYYSMESVAELFERLERVEKAIKEQLRIEL